MARECVRARPWLLLAMLLAATDGGTHALQDDLTRYELTHVTLSPAHANGGGGISEHTLLLRFAAFGRAYAVRMREATTRAHTNFHLHDGSGADRSLELARSTRTYAGVVDDAPNVRATATIGAHSEDVHARLVDAHDTLYVEPWQDGQHLVYWASDVIYRFNESVIAHTPDVSTSRGVSMRREPFFARYARTRRTSYEAEPVRRNRCELKLVADYAFFKVIGNGNYANAARYLVNMIERINEIFTAVDWGLSAGGRRLVNLGFVIKEMKILDKPNNTARTDDVPHFNSEHSHLATGFFNPMDVLKSFSIEEGTPSSCLTILVSGKIFMMQILGLANIGQTGSYGLCARQPYQRLFMNTGTLSIQRESGLIITRVVDLVFAHGRYIMHASSNSGYDNNNYRFSPCSTNSIHAVLYGLAEECFVDEQAALCGNGLVEADEQCDPGGRLTHGRAADDDRCCTPTCRLRARARCSPKHSECCNERCTFAEPTERCQWRNLNTCKEAAFCTGQSDKCPEPRAVANETACVDEGRCRGGECVPFCTLVAPGWSPCTCENLTESCLRCCRSPAGACMPVKPARPLPEGSICIHGRCKARVCVAEATDAATHFWRIIKDIGTNPSPKYFADYLVFIVVVASLVLSCPCGLFVLYRDRQRRRIREAAADNVFIVPTKKRLRRMAAVD